MGGRRAGLVFGLAALVAASCSGGGGGKPAGTASAVRFGFWGDTPYSGDEARALVDLVEQINDADLDLAIFVGDIFGAPCDNTGYTAAVDLFNSLRGPVVYLPGDNEWTDCHPTRKDPLERLAHIRRTMFATDRSFGRRPITVEQQQPDYPENGRWRMGPALFVSLNVAGSNNNHIADPEADEEGTPRGPDERRAAEAEYLTRDKADRDWLHQSFEIAVRDATPAVVVAIHADPGFTIPAGERVRRRVDGFDRFLAALADEAQAYAKPVLLLHGDSHRFVQDQPLVDAAGQTVANVTRIETYGSPDVGWVEVVLDPAGATPLRVEPRLVQGAPR
ncbi:MAG TPA: metallophosphoesterase family protein [Acidimicrobiales bacterium]|nr:metallophosphoesterase family protein [Acidimicrobiales bacterium]